jgi:hypothetical protein
MRRFIVLFFCAAIVATECGRPLPTMSSKRAGFVGFRRQIAAPCPLLEPSAKLAGL